MIETTFDDAVEVRTHKEEMVIECKGVDDITTKSEICQAFSKALNIPDLDESIVKSIRRSYGGTQTAKMALPIQTAKNAIQLNKIKIGWSVCRIRESKKVTKCFRCLEYGHVSKYCKGEIDRSNLCLRCGLEGHKIKDCNAEPCCMLCKARGKEDLHHVAGNYTCPIFRSALSFRNK